MKGAARGKVGGGVAVLRPLDRQLDPLGGIPGEPGLVVGAATTLGA